MLDSSDQGQTDGTICSLQTGTVFEPHYTLAELAKLWHLSRSTIRDWFIDEPGVLLIERHGKRSGKRTLTNMRIPESVAIRVHRKRVRR